MSIFSGFPAKNRLIQIPEGFFTELLPMIDNLIEMKVTLFTFWALQQQEGTHRYLRQSEALNDERLLQGLDVQKSEAKTLLVDGFEQAVTRGTLLAARIPSQDDVLYFANTPRGRSSLADIEAGRWQPSTGRRTLGLMVTRPNVFVMYEQHIGTISATIADVLRQAEVEYPENWIVDAIQIAAEQNARHWNYVESVLSRWASHGRQLEYPKHRRSDQTASGSDFDWSDYFQG